MFSKWESWSSSNADSKVCLVTKKKPLRSVDTSKLWCQYTKLFIYPGYKFKAVDMLITNFHLPQSSLLMLVSAFIGYDNMNHIYKTAVDKKYRFLSYGDAMLLSRK